MIVNNSPLGLYKPKVGCDCRTSDYSLPVALADSPTWQVNMVCDELTGGLEKMPCEENQIGAYTDVFARYQNDIGPEALLSTYLISDTNISFTDFEAAGNIFSTPVGFLPANRCFWLRYTVSNYADGYVQTVVDASETQRTSGTNPSREANGTYSEIYCTDADGRLRFQIGNDDNTVLSTFILSNIFLGCIRYSELYEFTGDPADLELMTFGSQTSICKSTTTGTPLVSLRDIPFIEGQIYKICFTIENSTVGSVDLLFNSTTPDTYTGNGRYCTELEYEDAAYLTQLQFELSTEFDGCISDITVYLVPQYRAELYDVDGNEVEDSLVIEQIGNSLKVALATTLDPGCYQLGIAESCSNFMRQFYGNILDDEIYSGSLDFGVAGSFSPVIITGGVFSLDFTDWDALSVGTHTFIHAFIIQDAICCNKLYDMLFNWTIDDNGNTVNTMAMQILLATDFAAQDTIITPGASAVFQFDDTIAGPCTKDIKEELGIDSDLLAALIGSNGAFIQIITEIVKANNDEPVISFTTVAQDSYVVMDQDTPQFCPEYYSQLLNVTNEPPCDTVLIKYRSPQNAFDFDYVSSGFTEADNFYNFLRIDAKLWKPNYPKTKFLQKASTGKRTNYYSDVDKKQILTTGLLPEAVHDALALALEHETLIIEEQEFVCESEEYAPSWDKNTTLASVEVDLFVQQSRKLNTKC